MAATQNESALTRLIRKLLASQKVGRPRSSGLGRDLADAPSGERRKGRRRHYSHWQLMSAYDGQQPPRQTDFRLVMCHDISPEGFSFFCDKLPRRKLLVIALGAAPCMFFEAEIVRREAQIGTGETGWLLGCRFVRRLKDARRDVAALA